MSEGSTWPGGSGIGDSGGEVQGTGRASAHGHPNAVLDMNVNPDQMPSLGLGDSYISLVDSLSAIRQLSEIDLEKVSESGLLEEALKALIRHQDLERCSIFLLEDNQLVCAAGCGIGEQLHSRQTFVSTDFRGSKTFAIGEGLVADSWSRFFDWACGRI